MKAVAAEKDETLQVPGGGGGGERFGPLGSSRAAGMERHALVEILGNSA